MDPPHPHAEDGETPAGTSGPTPAATTRLAGFLLAGLGALLMCVGALLPWLRTSYADIPDALSPTYFGIDLVDGTVVLTLGIVVLAALIVTRIGASPSVARAAAIVMIVASFAGVGVTVVTLLTADSRYRDSAVEDLVNSSGSSTDTTRADIEEQTKLKLAAGTFAAIGGGILAVAGGALTLAWSNARAREISL